jgi:hypothetical protein
MEVGQKEKREKEIKLENGMNAAKNTFVPALVSVEPYNKLKKLKM